MPWFPVAALVILAGFSVPAIAQNRADELMVNFADNVAAADLAVERCGAERTRAATIAKAAAEQNARSLVLIARGRILADVHTAFAAAGRGRPSELEETALLCRMLSQAYAGPGGVIEFPRGSLWSRDR